MNGQRGGGGGNGKGDEEETRKRTKTGLEREERSPIALKCKFLMPLRVSNIPNCFFAFFFFFILAEDF